LRVDILDRHAERRADAGERIHHQPDQCAVTQAGMGRDVDAVEQRVLPTDRAPAFSPDVTTCRGPRTEPTGLTGTTWPVTSQSNKWRIAARGCLTLGAASLASVVWESSLAALQAVAAEPPRASLAEKA